MFQVSLLAKHTPKKNALTQILSFFFAFIKTFWLLAKFDAIANEFKCTRYKVVFCLVLLDFMTRAFLGALPLANNFQHTAKPVLTEENKT